VTVICLGSAGASGARAKINRNAGQQSTRRTQSRTNAKQAGAVQERRKTFAPPHRVINLMEALRRSVAEDTKGAAPRKSAPTPARKRA
jgi:non-homologous end joining protein Ku